MASVSRLQRPQLLRVARSSAQCSAQAPLLPRIIGARFASKKTAEERLADKEKRPVFQHQLFQSIGERLARERVEYDRIQRKRGKRNPERLAVLFGLTGVGIVGYWIGSFVPAKAEPVSTQPLASAPQPTHRTFIQNMEPAWSDVKNIVGLDNVSEDEDDRRAHAGTDWSSYQGDPKDIPFMVVRPATTEEVSEVVKVCHTRRIPITAYSGGTSLEGHFSAPNGGICIDFSRMDQILKLNKSDMDVVVQPAVGWQELNEELAESDLFFPPDPGPGAMIGGMVGTGCSGTNAYRYGTMKDWVISLTVVLADGTIIKTRQRPRKSSAGYDLTRLFIGSEGTLGLVTEATLKVTVKPKNTRVAVCAFKSIRDAADCVGSVVSAGVPIAAIEILDDKQMNFLNDAGTTSKKWKEAPTLFFKFAGATPTAVKEDISIVQKLASKHRSQSFEFARNEEEADELWAARKEILWAVLGKKREPTDKVWTTDVAVPMSRLSQIIEETKADIDRTGLLGSIVGHVGDGNFHTVLIYNDQEAQAVEGLVHRMVKRAIELEGTVTGEHGVGIVKRDYLEHEIGKSAVDAMRRIKLAFDPLCILNCNKTVRVSKPAKGEIQEW